MISREKKLINSLTSFKIRSEIWKRSLAKVAEDLKVLKKWEHRHETSLSEVKMKKKIKILNLFEFSNNNKRKTLIGIYL